MHELRGFCTGSRIDANILHLWVVVEGVVEGVVSGLLLFCVECRWQVARGVHVFQDNMQATYKS